jgi:Protein of unknown function (DUF2851)
MNESFLQYLWQFQYFNKSDLQTTTGEKVEIFKQGVLNTNSGPDFSNAKIKIGSIEWAGNVELHTKASGWTDHKHDDDAAYENVVLHVVWQNDKKIIRKDGSHLPTLELKDRVDQTLIHHYRKMIDSGLQIPCENSLESINDITRLSMLDKALVERLQFKSQFVRELLKDNNNDWEETCYQVVAKNFGFKVNSDPFLQLARNLPYKILLKHTDHLLQVEALLFGVAGFLEGGIQDEYFIKLQKEFKLLSTKYSLEEKKLNPVQWRFLRLRPANFPTVRIAQFASMIAGTRGVFSKFIEAKDYADLANVLNVDQSTYWLNHYRFGKKANAVVNSLGQSSLDNVIINSVAPLMVAYGIEKADQEYIERAQKILQQVGAENNKITRVWNAVNWKVKTAFDSQALIELFNNYCQQKNCLNCTIGASILRPNNRT